MHGLRSISKLSFVANKVQQLLLSRTFKTSLIMQDDEHLNKTVWDPLEVFNSSSHYKYAVVILNCPLLWKNNILFQIWEKGMFSLYEDITSRKALKAMFDHFYQRHVYCLAQIKVTVDGGTQRWLHYLEQRGIDLLTGKYNEYMPNLITGDMDSCSPTVLDKLKFMGPTIVRTPDQDHSDYTKALLQLDQYARNENINLKAVYVFVESSGRFDHILGNINTLYKSDKLIRNVQIIHVASNSLTWILKPGFHSISIPDILVQNNSWCGLLPIGAPVNCITTTGLKWNLNNATMQFGGLVSSSNTYDNCSEVTIDTDSPVIWTMGIKSLVKNMDSHEILTFNSDSH